MVGLRLDDYTRRPDAADLVVLRDYCFDGERLTPAVGVGAGVGVGVLMVVVVVGESVHAGGGGSGAAGREPVIFGVGFVSDLDELVRGDAIGLTGRVFEVTADADESNTADALSVVVCDYGTHFDWFGAEGFVVLSGYGALAPGVGLVCCGERTCFDWHGGDGAWLNRGEGDVGV